MLHGVPYGCVHGNIGIPGWEWKRLKGCVFSPPFLLPVLGGPKEARKRNLSIVSIPVCLCPSKFYINVNPRKISSGTGEMKRK